MSTGGLAQPDVSPCSSHVHLIGDPEPVWLDGAEAAAAEVWRCEGGGGEDDAVDGSVGGVAEDGGIGKVLLFWEPFVELKWS